jgi:hypothetical protein
MAIFFQGLQMSSEDDTFKKLAFGHIIQRKNELNILKETTHNRGQYLYALSELRKIDEQLVLQSHI